MSTADPIPVNRRSIRRGARALEPFAWIAMAAAIAAADYVVGPAIRLNVLYAIPIGLAAWHHGRWWGTLAAVLIPLANLGFHFPGGEAPADASPFPVANAGLRMLGFVGLAWLVSHVAAQARRIQALEELIRICMHCKQIRDDDGRWQPVEQYISARTASRFSSFICPDCARDRYGYTE